MHQFVPSASIQVFDKQSTGFITASDLRAVLQCMGESLDEDESKDTVYAINIPFHLRPVSFFSKK